MGFSFVQITNEKHQINKLISDKQLSHVPSKKKNNCHMYELHIKKHALEKNDVKIIV